MFRIWIFSPPLLFNGIMYDVFPIMLLFCDFDDVRVFHSVLQWLLFNKVAHELSPFHFFMFFVKTSGVEFFAPVVSKEQICWCFLNFVLQVADVKKNIETSQGQNVYPSEQQMLIHQGKVLKDDTTLQDNKVQENSFIVVMLSKVYLVCLVLRKCLFWYHIFV